MTWGGERRKYIPADVRRTALTMIAGGSAPEQIMRETHIRRETVLEWMRRWREGNLSEGLVRGDTCRPKQLCLVDECHDVAEAGTKFCTVHTPKLPGTVSEFIAAPSLARLMAGR